MKKSPSEQAQYHHGGLRQALLDGALAMVDERGDASFGLRDLAKRVGVSHPALYRHFADRAALFSAIAYEGFSLYHETEKETLARCGDHPEEQLIALSRNHVRFALEHNAHFRIMFGARVREHRLDDSKLQAVARPTLQVVADVASRLKRKDAAADPFEFAIILWSSVHGLAMLGLDGQLAMLGKPPEQLLESFAEQSVRLLLQGAVHY